jgi:hypothetical protein
LHAGAKRASSASGVYAPPAGRIRARLGRFKPQYRPSRLTSGAACINDASRPPRPAQEGLAETGQFFEYLRTELPVLIERWRDQSRQQAK